MRYLYGPVQSRRLGLSLGISLTPYKVCSFDCLYCQLGKTTLKVKERKAYVEIEDVLRELQEFLDTYDARISSLDCISLSGFGEPTLAIDISRIIAEIKKRTSLPLVLITNAALFSEPESWKDFLGVDVIIPSLDAVTQDIFEKIDRPVSGIRIENIIEGLCAFQKMFQGQMYLEIMLIQGINDSIDYACKFKEAVERIAPHKIQLNTPVRSTTEKSLEPPDKKRLLEIKEILGPRCEIL